LPLFSPLKNHISAWRNCQRCTLRETRQRVVIARGTVPCDIVFLGEAPGFCLAGDTLIETAFRDKSEYSSGVPIRSLVGKKGFQVYSFDVEAKKIALGTVTKVWRTGIKKVYRVSYFWWGAPPGGKGGRHKYYGSIKVTANHPFLLKSGSYRSLEDGLTVGDRIQPFYRRNGRYCLIGHRAGSMKFEGRFLLESKIGRELKDEEQVHHDDRNKWNDSWDNLLLYDLQGHARLHGVEDNPMYNPIHRETHKAAMQSEEYRRNMSALSKERLASPEARQARSEQNRRVAGKTSKTVKEKFATDPVYYYHYLLGRRFRDGTGYSPQVLEQKFRARFPEVEFPPEDNHEVYKIESLGMEAVYDMNVEYYHNFAANGVFVHNSEDVLGYPFVGPAGQLMDMIIERSIGVQGEPWWMAFTNLVACIPKDPADHSKSAQPPKEAIMACQPRLVEFIALCNPRLIVCVGSMARDHLDPKASKKAPVFHKPLWYVGDKPNGILCADILHPAAILRGNVAQQNISVQRSIVGLRNAVFELEEVGE
jgi:uracil-DNA glycosylase family 4